MKATIKCEFTAGTEISKAFIEAKRLAGVLGCCIEFQFNGVACFAYADSNIEAGVQRYHTVFCEETKYKIVVAY